MKKKRSFIDGLRDYFGTAPDTVSPKPAQKLRLSGKSLRIAYEGVPFEIWLGRQRLHLYPDLGVGEPERRPPYDFILVDPDRYFSGISHFLRLRPGTKLDIDHRARDHRLVFSQPREVFRRHFQVCHEGEYLLFKDTISELGSYLALVEGARDADRLIARRRAALDEVLAFYGGPLEPMAPDAALATIRQVNTLLRDDPYRQRDAEGNPGGVLELPGRLTPIIVGDLHAQVDNLLKILSENAFMEGLKRGEAALIFLGDAVHPELPGQYDYMDSSVLIMDLILRLKLRFPRQVFFVIGNHDSFSADVMKAGVAQSLLWEQRLVAMRGAAYRNEMATFYQLSPLLVVSPDFIACHAAPTRSKVNLEMLVEIRRYPALVHEVTWNRGKAPGYPAGYTQGDVKRFRNSLGVKEDKPFIVGHFPRSATETVWLDVGEIRQHHVIYSARPEQVGIFTRIDGEMVAQVYPSEPLQAWLNTRACTSVELEAPAGAS